ncbi:MAG: BTAD domain-containing putative transcriptional regulator [Pseudonocardiaceae bacterium]
MEFTILGPLEVRDQHRRIEVSSTKERLLLTVLVVHANEVVSTSRLIETLWGTTPPVTAANTLQTYVSHLRRALEPDRPPRAKGGILRTHVHGYELVIAPESVDATRFERLARAGRDALASDPEKAAETLRTALRLWRGEPLDEFSFEFFAQAEIARLTELHAVAVEDRVEADLALGRHMALCSELRHAVAEQPFRERLCAQLIRALYRCGRQADALAAYARLREQLTEQLGIEPGPELVRLHEAVLAQCPDLDWSPPSQRPSGKPAALKEPPPATELLSQAHTALGARNWERAFELLSRAQRTVPLSAADLEGLAESAWWLGRYREGLSVRQRLHHAYLQAGDHRRAAFNAAILTTQYAGCRQFAVANGWYQRAQRLLEAEVDCAEHGYLSLATAFVALEMGDHEKCLVAALSTYDLGVRHGMIELQASGMVFQGTVLIRRGQIAEGRALQDEGMAMAVGASLAQRATVQIFCQVVRTCCELGDYRRAEEWTNAVENCFERTAPYSSLGSCKIHRIAIMIDNGAWALAEQEAQQACAAVQFMDLNHAGQAFASMGDIRLRVGDLAGAEEAFTKAEELLWGSSLPGQARLELLRGHPSEAAALINGALSGDGWDRLARTRLLPDQVTIALAVGDLDTARAAATELAESAQIYASRTILAAAERARAELDLVTGESCPLSPLRRSVALWRKIGSPYERARTQVLLATALELAGQPEPARLERAAARACFERLGAQLDAAACAEELVSTIGDRALA